MTDVIELPPTPASVAHARRWSADVVAQLGAHEVVETTALLVSELVSNVVLHAGTPCSLQISTVAGRVRVEVTDGSDALPGRSEPDPLAQSGRGMQLIDGLSAAHGVEREPHGGKRVWFELLVHQTA